MVVKNTINTKIGAVGICKEGFCLEMVEIIVA